MWQLHEGLYSPKDERVRANPCCGTEYGGRGGGVILEIGGSLGEGHRQQKKLTCLSSMWEIWGARAGRLSRSAAKLMQERTWSSCSSEMV